MRIILAVLVLLVASQAEARPRRTTSTYAAVPAGGDTSTAQGVAEIQARTGRVAHFGGNRHYREGCGCGPTPEAAVRNCCFYGQMQIMDQGVAQSPSGMWYATIRGQ